MWPVRPVAALHLLYLGRREVFANDLPAEIDKCFIDIGPPPRTRLIIRRIAPILCHRESLGPWHMPILLQIAFIAYYHQRDSWIIFDSNNLIS